MCRGGGRHRLLATFALVHWAICQGCLLHGACMHAGCMIGRLTTQTTLPGLRALVHRLVFSIMQMVLSCGQRCEEGGGGGVHTVHIAAFSKQGCTACRWGSASLCLRAHA